VKQSYVGSFDKRRSNQRWCLLPKDGLRKCKARNDAAALSKATWQQYKMSLPVGMQYKWVTQRCCH